MAAKIDGLIKRVLLSRYKAKLNKGQITDKTYFDLVALYKVSRFL